MQKVLGYKEWRYFDGVIKKAKTSCVKSHNITEEHFGVNTKMITIAKGGKRKVKDYKLSRYACYLIAQNGDSHISPIAHAQTYFAIQTRKMELTEQEYSKLTEDEKRLYRRKQTKEGNKALYKIALSKGVKNFDKFTNAGYKGLYNGETANDIAKRKGLRYREEILDHMGSAELSANARKSTNTKQIHKIIRI